jgi:tetratricopeptide (TPR) repeat protein
MHLAAHSLAGRRPERHTTTDTALTTNETSSGARRPPAPDCNLLWASSRGVCAHPECDRPLITFDGGRWTTLGEIAHIRAHSREGPRFDVTWTGSVDSYDNCLLLCRDHHRLVDSNADAYPVETLLEWKRQHELFPLGHRLDSMSHIAAPPPSARLAVVRGEPFNRLEETLATRSRVALLGLSGSGKTELARQWFTTRAADYTFRWWVRGHNRETLVNDLASLAPLLGLPTASGQLVETQAAAVRDDLAARGPWLLVVDNAGSPEPLADVLPTEGGHVIVTSQDQSWSGIVPPYLVPSFTDEEALELLRRSPALDAANEEDLHSLIDECRGHPLVVDQAAGYIARTGIGVPAYTELLRTRRPETMDRSAGRSSARFSESIQAALDHVGRDSRDVLAILTQVAPGPFEIWSVPVLEDSEPPGDPDDPHAWGRFRLEDALANLRAFSLVQRDGKTLVAHDLVTDVVRSTLTEEERFATFSRAVWTLLEQLPDRPSESFEWPTMERLLPHALAVLERADHLGEGFPGEATARILDRLAVYFGGRGQHERARVHFDRAVDLMQSRGVTDSSMYGSLLHNLANHYSERGDHVRAEALHREALDVKERALGERDLIVGVSCGALGAVLEARGDWEEASRYYERAASIYRHNQDHGWTANALIDLASIALKDDRPGEAMSLLETAIDEADRDGHAVPEAVTARLRLAQLVAADGDLAGAVKLARSARAVADAAAAPAQLASALDAQGRYLSQMGLHETGLALSRRSVAVWQEVHGASPVRYAQALGNYGYGLVLSGRSDLALQPLQESQAQLEQLLPTDDEAVAVGRLLTAKAHAFLLNLRSAIDLLMAVVRDAHPESEAAGEAVDLLATLTGDVEDDAHETRADEGTDQFP